MYLYSIKGFGGGGGLPSGSPAYMDPLKVRFWIGMKGDGPRRPDVSLCLDRAASRGPVRLPRGNLSRAASARVPAERLRFSAWRNSGELAGCAEFPPAPGPT